jgi:hypothetical protein
MTFESAAAAVQADNHLARFLKLAVAQAGDPYDGTAMGNVAPGVLDPDTLDCSEMVKWAVRESGVGVEMAGGSWLQYGQLAKRGADVDVETALNTPGALLFTFDPPPTPGGGRPSNKAHVAISLGDGRTIEAMSSKHDIKVAEFNPDRWTHAAIIPEFEGQQVDLEGDIMPWEGRDAELALAITGHPVQSDEVTSLVDPDAGDDPAEPASTVSTGTAVPDPLATALQNAGAGDADADMLADHYETRRGLDPHLADSDGDGITDGYELVVVGTLPDLADSDLDGMSDSLEVAVGRDPLVAEDPGAVVLPPEAWLSDTDGDGIGDWGEQLAGTDRFDPDSDDDGMLDGDELVGGGLEDA